MIKPESLWGLFKTCENSKWLGDICRALGRQDVELDYGQQMMLKTIQQDSGWMDERIEVRLERDRERKRKYRLSRDVTRNPCDTAESSNSAPSIQPSIQPSIHPREGDVRIRESDGRPICVPTDDEARSMARQINVPALYLTKFFEEMKNHGWGYVNRGGEMVNLNRRNFKAILRSFYEQAQKSASKRSGKCDTVLHQEKALPKFKTVEGMS